jgi:cytochrome P450
MIIANIEDHTKVRRILSVSFSERALRKQESLFRKHADLMVSSIHQAISKDPTTPLEMVKFFNFTTFDTMSDLTFGEPLGLQERNEYTTWVETIFNSIAVLPVVQIAEYDPPIKALFKILEPRSIAETRLAHFRHPTDRVDRRLSKGSNHPDIWNLIISGNWSNSLSLDEMQSNAEIFMTAGTETTATLLSGLCYLLLTKPDRTDILVQEIRSSFSDSDEINLDCLAGLRYMNACLEEALRVYPPVPSSIPRVTPEGGNVILGKWVAPGVSVCNYLYQTWICVASTLPSQVKP